MANILGFVGIAVSAVALIFAIIAVALNQWQTYKVGSSETSVGLWEYCVDNNGNEACIDIDSDYGMFLYQNKFYKIKNLLLLIDCLLD